MKDEQRHVSWIRLYINDDLSNGKNTNNNKKDENVILNFFHFWVLKNSFSLNVSVCKQKSNIYQPQQELQRNAKHCSAA